MLKSVFHMAPGFMGIAATALLSGYAVAGGLGDRLVRFSTIGPDRYFDGTLVGDGECYALVWSPKGAAFAGFNADGTPVSSEDRVVLAAPLAKDGRCRDAIFQVPAATYAELDGGEWAVCLVDTRTVDGRLAGVAANAPCRVNRWGMAKGSVSFELASASAFVSRYANSSGRTLLGSSASGSAASAERPVRAGALSAVPASVLPPRITAIDVSEGIARLVVEDTVPFLTYTLSSGDAPGALSPDRAADRVDGDEGAPIAIETEAPESSRFFRVTRAE